MNSRQRRKKEAAQHNALMIEREAYREDRVRDPIKYMRRLSADDKANRRLVGAVMAICMATGAKYGV